MQELKRLRKEKGLTCRQLAALAGTSHVTVSRIETGTRRPSLPMLCALAAALGVPPAALLAQPLIQTGKGGEDVA